MKDKRSRPIKNVKGLTSFDDGRTADDYVESLIDKIGLHNVMYAVAAVCGSKEVHLLTNWQDYEGASVWAYAKKEIEKLGRKLDNRGL